MPKSGSQPRVISAQEFAAGWDSERRPSELQSLKFHLRGTVCYVPWRTKHDIDKVHKAPTAHVKTRTFVVEKKVWVTTCEAGDPDARKLRPVSDTEGSGEFGFGIPLRKLNLKLPATRQYEFTVTKLPVEGGGAVYEISFADFERVRRDVDEAPPAPASNHSQGLRVFP